MAGGAQVIVAGAGALGLAAALELAKAGCRVSVCDPAPADGNASSVAAGMLAPAFEAALDSGAGPNFDLLLAARDLWAAMEAEAGVAIERSGAVAVGRAGWLDAVAGALTRLGLHASEIGLATLQQLAPGMSAEWKTGLLCREDWRLEPAAALAALRAAASAAGVEFRAERVRGRGGADFLIAATGAAHGLAPELDGVSPIKGHILRAEVSEVGRVSVRGEGVYAVPAAGGLAIGATMEPGVADPAVDPAKAGPLRAAGAALFPEVAQAANRLMAGVRGATADGLPLVGPSREPGVFVAAGARRNGWLLAPLVGRVIAAQVMGRDPGRYAKRLDPQRLG